MSRNYRLTDPTQLSREVNARAKIPSPMNKLSLLRRDRERHRRLPQDIRQRAGEATVQAWGDRWREGWGQTQGHQHSSSIRAERASRPPKGNFNPRIPGTVGNYRRTIDPFREATRNFSSHAWQSAPIVRRRRVLHIDRQRYTTTSRSQPAAHGSDELRQSRINDAQESTASRCASARRYSDVRRR